VTPAARPVVGYTYGGRALQVASRHVYRPSPHRKGDQVAVLVDTDGTAWIASEWDARQAERERDHASARNFPLVMGVLLLACAAFGILLGAGVALSARRAPRP
jgi:hypothetical protein